MASTSITSALTLLFVLHFSSRCEASGGAAIIAAGTATWRSSPTSVRSPEETCDLDMQSSEESEETCDVASFMFAGTELQRSPSSGIPAEAQAVKGSAAGMMPGLARPTEEAAPLLPEMEESGWEASFATGVFESKKVVEAEDSDVGSWVSDAEGSGAAVPTRMLQAEVLLQAAEEAPSDKAWKEKTAERALRLYYHAKWLAERNYARAAEHRYREAARLARSSRRSVLASHSLARLGYFLLHWNRAAEATDVLEESMKLNTKSNPLAPYLHGVLERKAAAGDIERLRVAEEHILQAGEQPSEELEVERFRLIDEISYWREAEGSPRQCTASSDAAYVLICFFGHAAAFLRRFF